MKTDGERYPDETQTADHKRCHGPGHAAPETTQLFHVCHAEAIDYAAQRQKQGAFHQGVVEQVQNGSGKPGHRGEADAQNHVADLRNAGVGEQALDIVLEDRRRGACKHRRQRQRQEDEPLRGMLLNAKLAPKMVNMNRNST